MSLKNEPFTFCTNLPKKEVLFMEMSSDIDQKRKEPPYMDRSRDKDRKGKESPYMEVSHDNGQNKLYISNELQLQNRSSVFIHENKSLLSATSTLSR